MVGLMWTTRDGVMYLADRAGDCVRLYPADEGTPGEIEIDMEDVPRITAQMQCLFLAWREDREPRG